MAIQIPELESTVLRTLTVQEQASYLRIRNAAERVSAKYPEMDTAIYTAYLNQYLQDVQTFKINTKSADGKPLHPEFIRAERRKAEMTFQINFEQKHFGAGEVITEEDRARIAANHQAMRRLTYELDGESPFVRGVRTVYDEEKGGWQGLGIIGGIAGGLLGWQMGSYIAGPGGGGWLGFIATSLITISGAALVANLAKNWANEPATLSPSTASPAVHSKERQVEQDNTRTLEMKTEKDAAAPERNDKVAARQETVSEENFMQLTPTSTPIVASAQRKNSK